MKVDGVEYHAVQDEKGCDGCALADKNSSYCKFAEEALCDLSCFHNWQPKHVHPHRDMIKKWVDDTTQVVEVYNEETERWVKTSYPGWDRDNVYRFRPSEILQIDEEIQSLREQLKALEESFKSQVAKLEERKAQLTKGRVT